MERVVVRHLRGSKANKIEQFPVDTFKELAIGRDQASAIAFDPEEDDLVSRRHALIRIHKGDKLSFSILDLQSSNGTFLNGERLERECELLVEDRIQLGSGGPEFVFDVEPRPAGMVARTRVFTASEAARTRMSETRVSPEASSSAEPEKVGVGKDTVERIVARERKSAGRKWMYLAAASLAGVALVGWLAYYRTSAIETATAENLGAIRAGQEQVARGLRDEYGMLPADIMDKHGSATVFIEGGWKVFDSWSGLPIFQKVHKGKPVYVEMDNKEIVPWLITNDLNEENVAIGSPQFSGSGFVIAQNGFILTNRHVAAGWRTQFDSLSAIDGLLVRKGQPPKYRSLNKDRIKGWVPEKGYLFRSDVPVLLYNREVPFEGRNHRLDVTFPKQNLRAAARLARISEEHDVALIKIDIPGDVPKVDLVPETYKVTTGEEVTILGYPGVSDDEVRRVRLSKDWLNPDPKLELVPEPTVTDAIISKQLANPLEEVIQGEQIRFAGKTLDSSYYQLSTSATGAGNSGGPVFNKRGEVLAIFTAGKRTGGAAVTYAVPISYGRKLLGDNS